MENWKIVFVFLNIFVKFGTEKVHSLDCVKSVTSCPCPGDEWETRSKERNCSSLEYVCMKTKNESLVEGCIHNYEIPAKTYGCPYVAECNDGLPTLARDFKKCSFNKTGCPPENHKGYHIQMIYNYTECTGGMSERCEHGKITSGVSTSIFDLRALVFIISLISIAVMVLLMLLIRCCRRRAGYSRDSQSISPTITEKWTNFRGQLVDSADEHVNVYSKRLGFFKKRFAGLFVNYIMDGRTPLSQAVHYRNAKVVSFLLRHGADFTKRNEANENPIEQGLYYSNPSTNAVPQKEETLKFLSGLIEENEMDSSLFSGVTDAEHSTRSYTVLLGNSTYQMDGDTSLNFKKAVNEAKQDYREVPDEILRMGYGALSIYRSNLKKDALHMSHIRCMVVGHFGVGKTTLVKGLLNKDQTDIKTTDGVEVYRNMCYIREERWEVQDSISTDLILLPNIIQVDFWDFAGQAIYYSTHPTYFSHRCLYLLVINAALELSDEVRDVDLDPSKESFSKIIDFLNHWIGTILHYSGETSEEHPKIIIVGTHTDKVQEKRRLSSLVSEIKSNFLHIHQKLICDEKFFVNAKSLSGDRQKVIRKIIEKEGKLYPTFGERIPTSWVTLQRKLQQLEKIQILPRGNLKELCEKETISMEEDELSLFLEFYTSLGQMLYFKDSALRNNVILDPEWLIGAMRSLITAQKSHAGRNIGKMNKTEIIECLQKEDAGYVEKPEHQQHILKVLDKLDLVCKPKIYDNEGKDADNNMYYIPCMFRESIENLSEPQYAHIDEKPFSIEKEILPPAVYHRLICSFLGTHEVYMDHLYCDTVDIQYTKNVIVRIHRRPADVHITVYFEEERDTDDTRDITQRVYSDVEEALKRIISSYSNESRHQLETDYHERGNESDGPVRHCPYFPCFKGERMLPSRMNSLTPEERNTVLEEYHLLNIYNILLNTRDKESDIVLRKLQVKTSNNQEVQNWIGHRLLIALSEWKTLNENRGRRADAKSLCSIVDEKVIHEALQKRLPTESASIPEYVQSRTVNVEFLDNVAFRISTKYFTVGIGLGISIDHILMIAQDNLKDTKKLNQHILRAWIKKNGVHATYGKLACVYEDANCRTTEFPKI